jgi:hypothetical protein
MRRSELLDSTPPPSMPPPRTTIAAAGWSCAGTPVHRISALGSGVKLTKKKHVTAVIPSMRKTLHPHRFDTPIHASELQRHQLLGENDLTVEDLANIPDPLLHRSMRSEVRADVHQH